MDNFAEAGVAPAEVEVGLLDTTIEAAYARIKAIKCVLEEALQKQMQGENNWYDVDTINTMLNTQLVGQATIYAAQYPLLNNSTMESSAFFQNTLIEAIDLANAIGLPVIIPINPIEVARLNRVGLPEDGAFIGGSFGKWVSRPARCGDGNPSKST